MVALVLYGCGAPPATSRDPEVHSPDGKPPEGKVLNSGPVTVRAQEKDGSQAWVLRGAGSRVGIDDDGGKRVFLTGVEGELYDKGIVASRMKSESAKANSETKSLVLDGSVVLVSEEQKATIKARQVNWNEAKRVFVAKGNVHIDSPDWTYGPMDEVWATPDLKKVGSPEKFK